MSWSPDENLGGSWFFPVTAVSWGFNRIDVFGVDSKSAVQQLTWDGIFWHNLRALGGIACSPVSAVSWAASRLDIFVVGADNQLFHNSSDDGSSWSDWKPLGGSFFSPVTAVSWGPNRIDLFCIGPNSSIFWNSGDGGSQWTGWIDVGAPAGPFFSPVAAVAWQQGCIDLFALGPGHMLWHRSFGVNRSGGWAAWEKLGGPYASAPCVQDADAGQLHVFAIGPDRMLWHHQNAAPVQDPWKWLSPTHANGLFIDQPTSPRRVLGQYGNVPCAFTLDSVGNTICTRQLTVDEQGQTVSWAQDFLGGAYVFAPSVVWWGEPPGSTAPRMDMFGVKADNSISHKIWLGP